MKAFDVDARSKERESQDITIGGQTFHPARRTTKVNASLRKARRAVVESRTQIEKLAAASETGEMTAAQLDEQDKLEEKVETATADMVAALIVDKDEKHPTAKFLQDSADSALLADLLSALITDEEPTEDPQTASTSS